MGMLFYGSGRLAIPIDDVVLAHLKILATSKLRRSEAFLLSWVDHSDAGGGRSSAWIHPALELHYRFDGETRPKIDPAVVEEMAREANQARGIELTDRILTHDPHEDDVATTSVPVG